MMKCIQNIVFQNYQKGDRMRVSFTAEMLEMIDKFKPYVVLDGVNLHLSEDAPDEIKEIYNQCIEISKRKYEEAWNDMM